MKLPELAHLRRLERVVFFNPYMLGPTYLLRMAVLDREHTTFGIRYRVGYQLLVDGQDVVAEGGDYYPDLEHDPVGIPSLRTLLTHLLSSAEDEAIRSPDLRRQMLAELRLRYGDQ